MKKEEEEEEFDEPRSVFYGCRQQITSNSSLTAFSFAEVMLENGLGPKDVKV